MKYTRVQEIKQLLLHEGRVNTADLSRRFAVSIETIRRDLDILEQEGFIRKVYGGAELNQIRDPADVMELWSTRSVVSDAEKRRIAFKGYQINDSVLKAAHPGAMVLHCLPAHRGEEITAEVFEAHANEIFDEAENRLHAQKAVLVKLLANT